MRFAVLCVSDKLGHAPPLALVDLHMDSASATMYYGFILIALSWRGG